MIRKSRLYKSCVGFPGDPGAGPGTQGCIFLYLCDFVNKCIAPTESVFIAGEGEFKSAEIRPAEGILTCPLLAGPCNQWNPWTKDCKGYEGFQ